MEIGSLFEIEIKDLFRKGEGCIPLLSVPNGFSPNYFNTGRAAIESLLCKLKSRSYSSVLLPSFICDSVRDAVKRAGMNVRYYRTNIDLSIDTSSIELDNKSILYIVQYFGQKISDEALSFVTYAKSMGIIVIEDISLSLLSRDDKYFGFGDYIVGSMRKWFPIPDGGVLFSRISESFQKTESPNEYTLDYFTAQLLKKEYLRNRHKKESQKELFLSYSSDAMQALFSDYTVRNISRLSSDLLSKLDFSEIRAKRISNYDKLRDYLQSFSQITVLVNRTDLMVPLGMVILVENRDELFQYLINKNIYCNIHWRRNDSTRYFSESEYLASRCITIPCDQRYGESEMQYIYNVIEQFYRG